MATAKRGRSIRLPRIGKLPTPDETAAEIQVVARRLGLLLDLHRIVARLRADDTTPPRSST